jgi:hypothetical protein
LTRAGHRTDDPESPLWKFCVMEMENQLALVTGSDFKVDAGGWIT